MSTQTNTASIRVITVQANDAQAEISRLLRLLPYSMEELEQRAANYELRESEQTAYRRIRDLQYLLGQD